MPDPEIWQPRHSALEALFPPDEIQRLEEARSGISGEERTIVYCVYENPFARAGGVAAVAAQLPPALRAAGERVVLLSPFHGELASAPEGLESVGSATVPFGGHHVPLELLEHVDKNENRWVLMKAPRMFDASGGPGRSNPYAHDAPEMLLRDALFASAAAPHAAAALGLSANVIFHLQDWQFAAAALTVKQAVLGGTLRSAATALTSHNPYDHALPDWRLSWISDRLGRARWPLGEGTVYQRMIPITDAPLTTVSPTFARELTEDQLQTAHFAGHLQDVYRAQTIVGVSNPLFGEPKSPFTKAARKQALDGMPGKILEEKTKKRREMIRALSSFEDERTLGRLDLDELDDTVPVFMMFGRLDPGQKGFDLLARAIEGFAPGEARFILAPSVSEAAGPWVGDLGRLAARRAGDVVVYPFRMSAGYMEAMAGASFIVMPSFYEPFGAATEAYLAGTPVVARATGGLIDQVEDFKPSAAAPTGVLFREKLPLGTAWPSILNSSTPEARVGVPLYAMMAEALFEALKRAATLWRNNGRSYGLMLASVFDKAQEFSGEASARGYQRIYDIATQAREM